ncbi:hypothetical protein QEP66_19095 [Streptomyces sp. LB8]|uniref:hypothetical protein n=1 Tax=Streptomyces sp. LB8 TaxID=3042509 RepID=UPI0026490592|nr:hypothetical protein [Streptomyces sp. LB8]MDN5384154.1 hypothetical protein [Streptomyces sp. LB8]
MGIESDQVVYEYLSRVGDVAQQRHLSSAARMRLVAELRDEIERRRARAVVDSPAAVRRILARLGSPDEVVAAAGGTETGGPGGAGPRAPEPSVPVQRDPGTAVSPAAPASPPSSASGPPGAPGPSGTSGADQEQPKGLRKVVPFVPRPRSSQPRTTPAPLDGPAPPHLATAAELGDSTARPDWWDLDGPSLGIGDEVPGFVGGVEVPELLKPPPPKDPAGPGPAPGKAAGTDPAAEEEAEPRKAPAARRRLGLSLVKGGLRNPLLLLAAGLLVAGAVLGNLFALLLGWLIAYGSRRLTPTESKWAVMVLPGLALTAGVVWLWGRADGRWGTPIAQDQMSDAVQQTWPWVVRAAAVLSALFLIWRSQRRR